MIFSTNRKLALSGWLKENDSKSYETPLKLQKYLLFYELFSKIDGEESDFYRLRGWKNGPVFSTVWGDYTKDRAEFDKKADAEYKNNTLTINKERACLCDFIVKTLTEKELSDFTHKLNLWEAKKERIENGESEVDLDERDFLDTDAELMKKIASIYPQELIDNSSVLNIDNYYFVFSNEDFSNLTELQLDTLTSIAKENDGLMNPVFVGIDDEGRLSVD